MMSLFALAAPRLASGNSRASFDIEPHDALRGYAPGPAPYRVLLIGGDLTQGQGVLTHQLALPGALARSLAARVAQGIDVDTAPARRLTIEDLRAVVEARVLGRYDALVLALDPRRASTERFAIKLEELMRQWAATMSPTAARIVVVAPACGRSLHAEQKHAESTTLMRDCLATVANVIELSTPDSACDPSALYADWADQIAEVTSCQLLDPLVFNDPADPVDECVRAPAAASLLPNMHHWEATFRRVVSLASAAYGTSRAALSLIDSETTYRSVHRGFSTTRSPRHDTICDQVLATYGGLIIADARTDPRFARLPGVRDGGTAFYAGYRVCDRNGNPVATLCVSDPEPRPVLTQDLALLREFAHATELRLDHLIRKPETR